MIRCLCLSLALMLCACSAADQDTPASEGEARLVEKSNADVAAAMADAAGGDGKPLSAE